MELAACVNEIHDYKRRAVIDNDCIPAIIWRHMCLIPRNENDR